MRGLGKYRALVEFAEHHWENRYLRPEFSGNYREGVIIGHLLRGMLDKNDHWVSFRIEGARKDERRLFDSLVENGWVDRDSNTGINEWKACLTDKAYLRMAELVETHAGKFPQFVRPEAFVDRIKSTLKIA